MRSVAVEVRVLADEQQHGGHRERGRDAVAGDVVQEAAGSNAAVQHDLAALLQRDERGHVEAADVEQRGHHQGDVVLARRRA